MFRTIVLGLSALFSLNRAVVTDTDNAHYDEVNRYTYSCNMSDLIYNNASPSWVFTIDRSWWLEASEVNNETIYDIRSTEDVYWFYDNSNYLVNKGIFAFWSGADFSVTTTITDNTYLSQSVNYDNQYPYLSLQSTFNSKDNSGLLFLDSPYLFSCNLFGSESDYVVTYYVTFANDLENTDFTGRSSYTGSIAIDSSNNVINVPYYNASNLTPNFVDNEILSIQFFITSGQDTHSTYTAGYVAGESAGYDNGYTAGYNTGFTAGSNSSSSFVGLLFNVIDTPIYYLTSLFNVEIFGLKVYAVLLSLITGMVIVWVVRKFVL